MDSDDLSMNPCGKIKERLEIFHHPLSQIIAILKKRRYFVRRMNGNVDSLCFDKSSNFCSIVPQIVFRKINAATQLRAECRQNRMSIFERIYNRFIIDSMITDSIENTG